MEIVKGDKDHHGNKVGAGDGCREDCMLRHLQWRGSGRGSVGFGDAANGDVRISLSN